MKYVTVVSSFNASPVEWVRMVSPTATPSATTQQEHAAAGGVKGALEER